MNKLSASEIRTRFLSCFERKGHRPVQSSGLRPSNDPTLLFTNAGMVQFKDLFLGREKREYTRAATSQKCLRVSGKHNDLENVGRTPRHHTFFEMLGNFSFGDYFKREAIEYAWELLTGDLGLPKDRLYVTVFQADDEAYNLWRDVIGVPEERIGRLGEADNFWAMGETGPCGPCSEIHWDKGPAHGPGGPAIFGSERLLEIWNLVFMQYDRNARGELSPLPRPSIDTGMGLERIASVVQGVESNYDTDLFQPIIQDVSRLAGKSYGEDSEDDVSMRVIADHSRAAAFLIGEGIIPSNEGRGYVLRRVMRRAIRHGDRLGFKEPFFHRACLTVCDFMQEHYPELRDNRSFIEKVVIQEETRFRKTLKHGITLLEEAIASVRKDGGQVLPGKTAFTLYDTYGFPLDLTQVIAGEHGLGVDEAGFDLHMEEQRNRGGDFKAGDAAVEGVYKQAREITGPTAFLGHTHEVASGRVLAIIRDGALTDSAATGDRIEFITDATPFYAESGGQVGDTGYAVVPANGEAEVTLRITDTRKPAPDLHIHQATVTAGALRKGDVLTLRVDSPRRAATRANHSATHLLHWALREVLGDHVKQAGSLVSPDRLRFDYTHFEPLTAAQTREIEDLVNERIRGNFDVHTDETGMDEARARGAMALFGEKYGDVVRVVQVSPESIELCGGTHVARTGDIGFFHIVSDGAVAAGVRRIEAVTGVGFARHQREMDDLLMQAARQLKTAPRELPKSIERLLEQQKSLQREIENLQRQLARGGGDASGSEREVNGIKVVSRLSPVADIKSLREQVDHWKDRIKSGVVVVGAVADGKATLVAGVTSDLTHRFQAGEIVKQLAAMVGGKGGGRADFAQAGGPNAGELPKALEAVYGLIG
ncbi:MAG: Alanine--tRNA ligase [Myxococcota bacterium]|nr:Alanine--tRNA ligase [Myxococcota bacterium]